MRSSFVSQNRIWKESNLSVNAFYDTYYWYGISPNISKAIVSRTRGINQQASKRKGHCFKWGIQLERYAAENCKKRLYSRIYKP